MQDNGLDEQLPSCALRVFVIYPFMHSEALDDQNVSNICVGPILGSKWQVVAMHVVLRNLHRAGHFCADPGSSFASLRRLVAVVNACIAAIVSPGLWPSCQEVDRLDCYKRNRCTELHHAFHIEHLAASLQGVFELQ